MKFAGSLLFMIGVGIIVMAAIVAIQHAPLTVTDLLAIALAFIIVGTGIRG